MKKQTAILLTWILGLTAFTLSGIAQASYFEKQIKLSKPSVGVSSVNLGDDPPANDNFANAMPIVLTDGTGAAITTNINATEETGEPDHAENSGGRSVWFKFTPSVTTVVRVNTTDSTVDTLLAVYTGNSVGSLQLIGYNDDCHTNCGGASTVDLKVIGGTTYYMAVDGYNDGTGAGAGTFKIAILDNGIPFQDDFASAYYLGTAHGGSIAGTNHNATIEQNEPAAYTGLNPNGKSVWYRWTPTGSFTAAVELSENFDSQVGIYTSDVGNPTITQLQKVVANIDYTGFTDARYRTTFFAENGKTYWFKIDWHDFNNGQAPTGNFQLKFYPYKFRYSGRWSSLTDKTAISVFRPASGVWYNLRSVEESFTHTFKFGTTGDIPVPADYNGDGATEWAVVRNENGQKIWYVGSGGSHFTATQWGVASDKAMVGDFDGDSRADLVAIRNNGQNLVWYVRRSLSGTLKTFTFGINFDKPVLGDFDGDGMTDVAVMRNTQTGWIWHILKSHTGNYDQYTSLQFGVAPDVAAVEDFDGDGKTDIAVFRPSTGVWYIIRSGDGQVQVTPFGISGDKPQPADYNGDGKADLAVFRPSEGMWYIAKPTGVPAQNFWAIQWGVSTDIPVSSLSTLSQ